MATKKTKETVQASVNEKQEKELKAQEAPAEEAAEKEVLEAQAEAPAEVQAVATRAGGRYYVVVGAYQDRHNAEKKKQRLEAAGYTAVIFTVRDGLKAVAAGPSATRDQAAATMAGLRRRGLCPEDGWILKLD